MVDYRRCIKCNGSINTYRKGMCGRCYRQEHNKLNLNKHNKSKKRKLELYYSNRILKPKPPKFRICVSCKKLLKHHSRGMCHNCYKKYIRSLDIERYRSYLRKSYRKNKEKRLKHNKEYYRKNKIKHQKLCKGWYEKNRESELKRMRLKYKNTPKNQLHRKSKLKYKLKVERLNKLRKKLGLPLVNDVSKYINEKMLFRLIQYFCPELKITRHKKFKWLGRKHIDIFFEDYNIGIEYDGMQHHQYIEFFHKDDIQHLEKQKRNDILKDELCKNQGVVLHRWSYKEQISEPNVLKFLKENNLSIQGQTTIS